MQLILAAQLGPSGHPQLSVERQGCEVLKGVRLFQSRAWVGLPFLILCTLTESLLSQLSPLLLETLLLSAPTCPNEVSSPPLYVCKGTFPRP